MWERKKPEIDREAILPLANHHILRFNNAKEKKDKIERFSKYIWVEQPAFY